MKDQGPSEKNKNLEVQEKKPAKSWLFRIGLVLFVLAFGLILFLALAQIIPTYFFHSEPPDFLRERCGDLTGIYFCEPAPTYRTIPALGILAFIGLGLVLINYFGEFRNRKKKILLVQLAIVLSMLVLILGGLKWLDFFNMLQPINQKVATSTKNELFCSLPGIENYKEQSCILEVARLRRDPRPCTKIGSSWRNICYTDIARVTRDVTVCDKLKFPATNYSDENLLESCYERVAQLKKDAGLCERFTGHLADGCYLQVAEVKGAALCERITDWRTRRNCNESAEGAKSDFYFGATDQGFLIEALARNDLTICGKIKDSFERSVCLEALK
ncbi:MAG: hypothetical protein A2Z24_01890 [Candidatus Woykebacteria bacterium RBG_16_44_10]|uniref:Uncharacterized protein n=1 Tax=Candidatus Woykebacteria bacterium RBG_16_44_10 TaxID=1802597 RepID=A0A1G1WER0_9BACT|nr:MAG: hypothetical protein A2Z24_01890 [Candidatus Woykebacteria bacterium RBG_16_44_10]